MTLDDDHDDEDGDDDYDYDKQNKNVPASVCPVPAIQLRCEFVKCTTAECFFYTIWTGSQCVNTHEHTHTRWV